MEQMPTNESIDMTLFQKIAGAECPSSPLTEAMTDSAIDLAVEDLKNA